MACRSEAVGSTGPNVTFGNPVYTPTHVWPLRAREPLAHYRPHYRATGWLADPRSPHAAEARGR